MTDPSDRRPSPTFDDGFRHDLLTLFRWRRDVRRFRPDPVCPRTIEALFAAAALSPSVGLSEPWRFVLVEDAARRAAIRRLFESANASALAETAPSRRALYTRLKLSGLAEAPVQFAVFAEPEPDKGGGLGRRTMPETTAYSAVLAVHTLWLAARAEGIGLGWVSILDPAAVAAALDVPDRWTFVGYFCLGHPAEADEAPELERQGWERRAACQVIRR